MHPADCFNYKRFNIIASGKFVEIDSFVTLATRRSIYNGHYTINLNRRPFPIKLRRLKGEENLNKMRMLNAGEPNVILVAGARKPVATDLGPIKYRNVALELRYERKIV